MPQNSEGLKSKVVQKVGLLEEYSETFLNWLKEFIPNLVFAILALMVGLWLIKQIAGIADKAMSRRQLEVSLRTFLKSLIGIGLKIILIILVAGMIGIQTTSFVAILGAAGLAIGLALQGSLSNFAGGVLILIFKPYKVGDTIEVMGQQGEVLEIQIFNTILLTSDHRTVILPNGAVSNGFIINFSRHGNLRSEFELQISDTHPVEEVRALLQRILDEDSEILKNPATGVSCSRIVSGGYVMQVRFFTLAESKSAVSAEIMERVKKVLSEKQISAPEVHTFVHNR